MRSRVVFAIPLAASVADHASTSSAVMSSRRRSPNAGSRWARMIDS
jgi:hypothetical protein